MASSAISAPGELVAKANGAGRQPALICLLGVQEPRSDLIEDQPSQLVLDNRSFGPQFPLIESIEIGVTESPGVVLVKKMIDRRDVPSCRPVSHRR